MTIVQEISNQQYATALLMIMISKNGHETVREALRNESEEFLKKLTGFLNDIEKKGQFDLITSMSKSLGKEEITEAKVRKIVSDITTRLSNISDKEIDAIINLIQSRYMIGQYLLIEGMLLGFYDYIRSFMELYFQLIVINLELQKKITLDEMLLKIILKLLPEKTIINAELLKKAFSNVEGFSNMKGLQTLTEQENDPTVRNDILQNNIAKIRLEIDYTNEKMVKSLYQYNPANSQTVKAYEKFQKKIAEEEQTKNKEIRDRTQEIDASLLTLANNIIFQLIESHKVLFSKELKGTLKKQLTL